ncbi:von Willebrand factor type A domain protein [Planctomycetes bacterium CA13]|uniref:von Willebrand factor type A domain protein n=1 Tax=Novipirellula herctigrandis TaxID=2527986 RepID=A0A5C5Z3E7_9BACT|nr:von Willebrand factor type A domain protein [Planctomycetes bacterium CA13]
MLTFAYPWLLCLAPLPLLVRWLLPASVQRHPAVRVPFLDRIKVAGGSTSPKKSSELGSIIKNVLVWLLLLAAVARPQWLEPPIERTVPTRDLLLLVDLSGSMDQEDFTDANGNKVNRLAAVKEVLSDFLSRREGDRVGLVVFGNAPFLQVPFTTDLSLCSQLLEETAVGMAGPKTALGDAIGLGIQLFENSDVPTKTMIALTDGNDTGSQVPPTEAARVAKDRQITIHTVAIGDPTTAGEEKLDLESLRGVSEATGGSTFLALDRSELQGIYGRLDKIETREVNTVSHRPRRDLYFWLVAVALILSLGEALWTIFSAARSTPKSDHATRLRVDARTFELQTVEADDFAMNQRDHSDSEVTA